MSLDGTGKGHVCFQIIGRSNLFQTQPKLSLFRINTDDTDCNLLRWFNDFTRVVNVIFG